MGWHGRYNSTFMPLTTVHDDGYIQFSFGMSYEQTWEEMIDGEVWEAPFPESELRGERHGQTLDRALGLLQFDGTYTRVPIAQQLRNLADWIDKQEGK